MDMKLVASTNYMQRESLLKLQPNHKSVSNRNNSVVDSQQYKLSLATNESFAFEMYV